jgi:hypothetical protein
LCAKAVFAYTGIKSKAIPAIIGTIAPTNWQNRALIKETPPTQLPAYFPAIISPG